MTLTGDVAKWRDAAANRDGALFLHLDTSGARGRLVVNLGLRCRFSSHKLGYKQPTRGTAILISTIKCGY